MITLKFMMAVTTLQHVSVAIVAQRYKSGSSNIAGIYLSIVE